MTVPASPFNWINVRVFSRAGIRARTKPRRLFRAPIDRSNFHSIPGDSNRDQRKTTRPSDNSQRFLSRYSLRFTTSFSSLNIFLSFFFSFLRNLKNTNDTHGILTKLFFFFFFSLPLEFVVQSPKSSCDNPLFFSFYSSKRRIQRCTFLHENKGRRGCARDGSKCVTRERECPVCAV